MRRCQRSCTNRTRSAVFEDSLSNEIFVSLLDGTSWTTRPHFYTFLMQGTRSPRGKNQFFSSIQGGVFLIYIQNPLGTRARIFSPRVSATPLSLLK